MQYVRLLGTNGGVKNETIVFISERHAEEIRRRIDNGRDLTQAMALASASVMPFSSSSHRSTWLSAREMTSSFLRASAIGSVSERHAEEIRRRIDNGRDLTQAMVPAKLEAYKALTCSASVR